jgi:hypothetical protein
MLRALLGVAGFLLLGQACVRADVILLNANQIYTDSTFSFSDPSSNSTTLPETNNDITNIAPPFSTLSVPLKTSYADANVSMSATAQSNLTAQYGPGQAAQIVASASNASTAVTSTNDWISEADAQSGSFMTFTLTSPYLYHLTGQGSAGGDYGSASVEGFLNVYGTNNVLFSWGTSLQTPGVPVSTSANLSGELFPGSYVFNLGTTTISTTLFSDVEQADSHLVNGTETLTLAPAPEPMSFALLVTGIVALGGSSALRRRGLGSRLN